VEVIQDLQDLQVLTLEMPVQPSLLSQLPQEASEVATLGMLLGSSKQAEVEQEVNNSNILVLL
jgi:hypothetical protein